MRTRFVLSVVGKSFSNLVALLVLVANLSVAQDKKVSTEPQQHKKLNIAVLDFDARAGVSKEEAVSFSDVFQSQMVEMGEFTIVDRARIKAILSEQGFQQSGACSDVECIVETGKILKVEKMFAGVVSKIGKTFAVNVQLIDIATAQIQMSKSRQHAGEIDVLISDVIPDIAAEMASEILGKQIKSKVASTGGGSSWLWYVGGAAIVGGGAAVYLMSQKPASSSTNPSPLPIGPPYPTN